MGIKNHYHDLEIPVYYHCKQTIPVYYRRPQFRGPVVSGLTIPIPGLEYSTSLVCRPASSACVGKKFIRHVRSSFHFRMHALNSCMQTDADEKGRQDAPNNLFSSARGMEGQQARGAPNLLSVARLNHQRCTVTLNFKLQPCIHVKLKHQMCIFLFLSMKRKSTFSISIKRVLSFFLSSYNAFPFDLSRIRKCACQASMEACHPLHGALYMCI